MDKEQTFQKPVILKADELTYKSNMIKLEELKNNSNKGSLVSYYINIFIKSSGVYDFKDFEFLHRSLLTYSHHYNIIENKEKISITYDTMKIDFSEQNFLYTRFMKFHLGFLQFIDWFNKYKLNDMDLDDGIINDYSFKQFYVCLENSRRQLGNIRITELTDLQLISKVCVRERLTLYNYLTRNTNIEKKDIKNYLNNEYIRIIKEKKDLSQLRRDLNVLKMNNFIEFYKI